ncbi:MAG: DUF5606 domain-containing protein [Bacteroidales bacterium]|nr:DUF5606 domain-containing protein [Bacteroidales bacterium]
MEKTDLAKILSASGYHGLYRFVAQARNGAIAESLEDGKRLVFPTNSRVTSLQDVAIYTSEGEMRLAEVFTALKTALKGAEAPGSKSSEKEIRELFDKAVPDYDPDRFYISHMKKVVDWYNELLKFASLEFVTDEDRQKEQEKA